MQFKEAQIGMLVYIFNRNDLILTVDKIKSVNPSHFDINIPSGKMVVDVTTGDKSYTIDDTLTIAYFNNCAISLDREHILREIEVYKNNSESILHEIPRHRLIVEKCNDILIENNPTLKEKQEAETRFNKIEDSINELKNMFKEFIK
jgi:hypothetical protein